MNVKQSSYVHLNTCIILYFSWKILILHPIVVSFQNFRRTPCMTTPIIWIWPPPWQWLRFDGEISAPRSQGEVFLEGMRCNRSVRIVEVLGCRLCDGAGSDILSSVAEGRHAPNEAPAPILLLRQFSPTMCSVVTGNPHLSGRDLEWARCAPASSHNTTTQVAADDWGQCRAQKEEGSHFIGVRGGSKDRINREFRAGGMRQISSSDFLFHWTLRPNQTNLRKQWLLTLLPLTTTTNTEQGQREMVKSRWRRFGFGPFLQCILNTLSPISYWTTHTCPWYFKK